MCAWPEQGRECVESPSCCLYLRGEEKASAEQKLAEKFVLRRIVVVVVVIRRVLVVLAGDNISS